MGRFGLFGPSAMGVSVEPSQLGIDPHPLSQDAAERLPRGGPLEAGQPPAGVGPPTRPLRRMDQRAVAPYEAHELGLRRLAPAPRARPDRNAHAAGSSSSAASGSASGVVSLASTSGVGSSTTATGSGSGAASTTGSSASASGSG